MRRHPRGSAVSVGLLLPDVLGTYSDSGNAVVLAQRLRWRGIAAEIVECRADRPPALSCDLYLIGGGEDTAQHFAAEWLRGRPALCRVLRDSAVTLAVCAGMQVLGRTMPGHDDRPVRGADLLDLTTGRRRRRAVGHVTADATITGVGRLYGFENHSGATTLGPGTAPLAVVRRGVGNGDRRRRRRGEGVVAGRIVGTYLHGPVLAGNPALADHLLTLATGAELAPLEVADQELLRASYLRGRERPRSRRPR